ncbi:hypothetical protein INR49_022832 [Caranx melampygus]|nr:hypothetical protein INR49_022832 [Caranx melampygus]
MEAVGDGGGGGGRCQGETDGSGKRGGALGTGTLVVFTRRLSSGPGWRLSSGPGWRLSSGPRVEKVQRPQRRSCR